MVGETSSPPLSEPGGTSTPPPPEPPVIAAAGVAKAFGRVRAVEGVSVEVHRGERVALLGPNGAGKSTLISIILGLLAPDRGRASLFGGGTAAAARAGRVGAVLQDGGLLPGARVEELLRLVQRLHHRPAGIDRVLEMTQLSGVRRQRADRLSGGQTQRVRAALALIGDPELLVLDEPTAGLDVEARRSFWTAMDQQAGRGRTLVFSTHYLQEVDGHSERVLVMAGGRLVADGPPSAIRASVGLRSLSFTLDGATAADAGALPGVASARVQGDRVKVLSRDTDAALRALLSLHPAARDIEVTGVDLEEAFLALTDATRERAA